MSGLLLVAVAAAGLLAVAWGADTFAEHVAGASARLGVSTFALALLLAGAEPEELATAVAGTVRHVPAVSFGDAVGANAAMVTLALGAGALLAPLPFGRRISRWGWIAVPLVAVSVALAWDGRIGRAEGLVLVALYAAYVAVIWTVEREPPAIGEVEEVEEHAGERHAGRVGRELGMVAAGLAAIVAGSTAIVEAVRHLTGAESTQTVLGLTAIGLATSVELVVLVVAAARRGVTEAAVAATIGSFAYNATMTLGGAALVRPLRLSEGTGLHAPMLYMAGAFVAVLVGGTMARRLGRAAGIALLVAYAGFIAVAVAFR